MSEPTQFALKPGVRRGDSAFLLNRGPHRLAFDSFPGRAIALAFLGSAGDPETDAALQTLAAHRRLVEVGKAAFSISLGQISVGRREPRQRLRGRPSLGRPPDIGSNPLRQRSFF
jgi:hypothetical protein